MHKNMVLEAEKYTHYRKFPEEGFPQRINYIPLTGPWISDIQSYDIIFDEKDLEMRFPRRNKKLLKENNLI